MSVVSPEFCDKPPCVPTLSYDRRDTVEVPSRCAVEFYKNNFSPLISLDFYYLVVANASSFSVTSMQV